ncbi:hypothetical protein NM688_g6620 [Phlebia brevispora]|uniref:Uncharacterized protein n=1 Tax=Phlebia brevispora TaxID=194682 RepID=A0ACC1SE58_9APHY|nr:hypothetical protein NM688_g6620 [Phlebia brevispora]
MLAHGNAQQRLDRTVSSGQVTLCLFSYSRSVVFVDPTAFNQMDPGAEIEGWIYQSVPQVSLLRCQPSRPPLCAHVRRSRPRQPTNSPVQSPWLVTRQVAWRAVHRTVALRASRPDISTRPVMGAALINPAL